MINVRRILSNSGFGRAARSIARHASPTQKRKIAAISVLIFISATLDVVGLAAILPLIQLGTDSSAIHNNVFISSLYEFMGFASEEKFIVFMVLSLLGYFLFKSVFGVFVTWMQARLTAQIATYITRNQFEKYYDLSYADFIRIKSSLIIRNVLSNPLNYAQYVINPLTMIISESIIVLLIIGSIAYYDLYLLGFMFVIIVPASVLIYSSIRKRVEQKGAAINSVIPFAMSSLQESIFGFIDIKLSGKEQQYKSRFMKLAQSYHQLHQSLNIFNQIPLRTSEVIALVGIVLIFLYGLLLSDKSGDLIIMVGAFAVAAYRLMPSMNRILNSLMLLSNNLPAIDNLDEFDHLARPSIPGNSNKPVHFEREIRFDHVTFRFPDSGMLIFKDLTFDVRKGETIGFIGKSGTGKTTLMNLLLRFYTEESGRVMVDDTALDAGHTDNWRKLIGYVKQDIFLMDGSIRDNITMGDETVNEDMLLSAVRQASLDDFIAGLPAGLDTEVGEKGTTLSGGQKQRISIARSLYRNAEVLIFDEATSALDNTTEIEVTESIEKLSKMHKTIFIIAHRITTLRNCNRIYELHDGRIAAVHSYKELIEQTMA